MPMDAGYVPLSEFAPQVASTCGPCNLPADIRSEMQAARRQDPKRFTYPIISRWLAQAGHSVHPDALRRHFNRGHCD